MNSRIRYIKDSDGTMSGNKYYLAQNGMEYSVGYKQYINEYDNVCIGYIKTNGDVTEIRASSPHKIKIAIKKELEARGCVFEKETRSASEA